MALPEPQTEQIIENDPYVIYLVEQHQEKLRQVERAEVTSFQFEMGNVVEMIPEEGRNKWKWKVYVRPLGVFVTRVTFKLHPTFQPTIISLVEEPFEVERIGWGEFTIGIKIQVGEEEFEFTHDLCLSENRSETCTIQIIPQGHQYPRMTGVSRTTMHGQMVEDDWLPPFRVVECDEEARPGYNSMAAHEYDEDPRTLRKKIRKFCELLRQSKKAMAYTGAGISTSSGIDDYASKAKDSKMYEGRKKPKLGGLHAQPSLGHRVLAELFNHDLMQHWVQQNHDGLPQKAGFPQHEINEIHGAWFDCSNPVVPMSGTLRSDLCEWMEEWIKKADLTVAMGTSLCGMNADRCVGAPSSRYCKRGKGFGSIIVGLQQTAYDEVCSLRIFARIDKVMALVCHELGITVPPSKPYQPDIPEEAIVGRDMFKIPYNSEGVLSDNPDEWIVWNLNKDQKHKVVSGPGEGFVGKMVGRMKGNNVHYSFCTKNIREGCVSHGKGFVNFCIGAWWVETAAKGLWHQIPIVNLEPVLQKDL